VKLTTHLYPVPRTIIRGAIPPLPNTPSWRGAQLRKAQRQLHLYLCLTRSEEKSCVLVVPVLGRQLLRPVCAADSLNMNEQAPVSPFPVLGSLTGFSIHNRYRSTSDLQYSTLCYFSMSVYCCKRTFRYRLSPETFGYTLVRCLLNARSNSICPDAESRLITLRTRLLHCC
jgi:hypothetical protein